MKAHHPLWQLFLFRMRALVREPAALFWIFAFPLLTSLALGLAFRRQELPDLRVAVVEGSEAARYVQLLSAEKDLVPVRLSEAEARDALRRAQVALVLKPGGAGETAELLVDPMQSEGRTARVLAERAVAGRAGGAQLRTQQVTAPGSRYIDFLIPGLLGFGLMSSGIWGLGWALVQMRTGKLLKRLVATPMSRSHFLLSFVLSRSVLALAEVLFFVLFARLAFGVQMFGSYAAFILFGLAGSLSFSGLSLLVASRAQNSETAQGLMNLVTMPMMILSGVFFSASNFPAWMQPLVRVLPLTALNDGLRAIMTDGLSLASLGPQLAVLAVWGLLPFALALRIFRWV